MSASCGTLNREATECHTAQKRPDTKLFFADCDVYLICEECVCITVRKLHKLFSYQTVHNRRSSEIQGTALGKSCRAWTCIYIYIYRSMHAGVAQSRHAFAGGTESKWAR